jgi:hypothetical protein
MRPDTISDRIKALSARDFILGNLLRELDDDDPSVNSLNRLYMRDRYKLTDPRKKGA